MPKAIDETDDLTKQISRSKPGQAAIETSLSTSDRVLRRVTDGIYRAPWSALREIVSNAYDADATEVTIDTDAPRFSQIRIRDNGNGFTAASLATMIKSIGGSTKRTEHGADAGVTREDASDRSPGGRKLIGKLGIGLFAVSQLTHEFQIITKRKGDKERTVADVLLFQYAEGQKSSEEGNGPEFHPGTVRIWKIPARDSESQGTEIILRNLLPRTKGELCSDEMWNLQFAPPDIVDPADIPERPLYHIGNVSPENPDEFRVLPTLPWGDETDPIKRFTLFTQKMFERGKEALRRPSLENTFDNYLKFIWYLSLAAPLDYLDKHPFDLDSDSGIRFFVLSNISGRSAKELTLEPGQTIRQALKLKSPERGGRAKFKVVVDGVALRRPIRFKDLPRLGKTVDTPMLFIGQDTPDLSKYSESIRGGDLSFEAYLLWTPRVVPVEHNGSLIRVNDASGTLFDDSFMKYQISEQNRMSQSSAEIFVTTGLDAALNIDRESFNTSHPHYQYIASWLHGAFRQFATRHKDLSKTERTKKLLKGAAETRKGLSKLVGDIVENWAGEDESPVDVTFYKEGELESKAKVPENTLAFSSDRVFDRYNVGDRVTNKKAAEYTNDQAMVAGIAQVLYAAGVFDDMSREKQERLMSDIAAVIFARRS